MLEAYVFSFVRRVSQGNGKKNTNQFILYQPSEFFIWTALLRPVTHLFMILPSLEVNIYTCIISNRNIHTHFEDYCIFE